MEKAQSVTSGKAKWTVMVYMAGDNNLDGAALRDITEMAVPIRFIMTGYCWMPKRMTLG